MQRSVRGTTLGLDENSGGQDTNKTCNRTQLVNENAINTIEPQFVDHTHLNFHPVQNSSIYSAEVFIPHDFIGTDRPSTPAVPVGNLINRITIDYDRNLRTASNPPGAFIATSSTEIKAGRNICKFRLDQNYPNPFNPTTVIGFSVPGSGFVSLKVYDVLGREVTALVNEVEKMGSYEIMYDASRLPSGVYFYRLFAKSFGQEGNFSETKKLIVVR